MLSKIDSFCCDSIRGRLQRTSAKISDFQTTPLGAVYKGRPANWEGGGFEISDISGRGEGGGL